MKAIKKHKGALIALGIFIFLGLMFACNITAMGLPCFGDPNECPGMEMQPPANCCCCSELNDCIAVICCCDESCYECIGGYCRKLLSGYCECVSVGCND